MRQSLILLVFLLGANCVFTQDHPASLTKEQARADFMVFIDAVREGFPGLDKAISEEKLDRYVTETLKKIDTYQGNLSFREFASIMRGAESRVHDSHLNFKMPAEVHQKGMVPQIWIGSLDGKNLICTNAIQDYKQLVGNKIKSVNGISSGKALSNLRVWVEENTPSYDGLVESVKELNLATMCYTNYGLLVSYPAGMEHFDMSIEFEDGEKVEVKGWDKEKNNGSEPLMVYNLKRYFDRPREMTFSMLNDSVGYICIPNVRPYEADKFRSYIQTLIQNKVPNLIIDVRNNGGGNGQNNFFTHIARETLIAHSYAWVKKKGGLMHSLNLAEEMGMFPELQPEEGHPGFLRRGPGDTVRVHPTINYKGRVYMLTNENCISAGTLLTAMLMKNKRGVVVGRETPTAYHYMNAVGFNLLQLPNSKLVARFAMLETWFDIDTGGHIPVGRGVLPDYSVPFTLEELYWTDGDVMLNYTLGLIRKGDYKIKN